MASTARGQVAGRRGRLVAQVRRPPRVLPMLRRVPPVAGRGGAQSGRGERAAGGGHVALVGAGPGDPELLTVRAARLLAQAEVVLHDALLDPAVLELAPPTARLVDVGKRAGGHTMPQEAITARLVDEARSGARVVRLKGGDPFVFGRGGEEALALAEAGIDFEVVPGISSAVAVPAAAGIPVTHRGVATHFTVVTGHGADDAQGLEARWAHLARAGGTLVFLMPTRNLERILATLQRAGMAAELPAALVCNGTRAEQQVIEATLATLAAEVARCGGAPTPATLVVGEVVALRRGLLGVPGLMASDGACRRVPDATAVLLHE